MSGNKPLPTTAEDVLLGLVAGQQRLSRRGGVINGQITGDLGAEPTKVPDARGANLPTEAPSSSPAVEAFGDEGGITLVVKAPDVAATTTLDYYMDGELVASTTSRVVRVTMDNTGNPLVGPPVEYSFFVVARNVIDSATPSATVTASLNPEISQEIVRQWASFGFVLAGAIRVGNLTLEPVSDDPITGEHNPGGLKVELTNGGIIWFPADGSDAVITAKLRAREIFVEDHLTINGSDNDILGGVHWASGVKAPKTAPNVYVDWAQASASTQLMQLVEGGTAPRDSTNDHGLHWTGTQWVIMNDHPYYPGWSLWDADGDYADGQFFSVKFSPKGGATKIGTTWYVLGQEPTDSNTWWVRMYHADWTIANEWKWANAADVVGTPRITSDGTNLVIVYKNVSTPNRVILERRQPNGVHLTYHTLDTSFVTDIRGVSVGNADFGAARCVVASPGSVRVYGYNTGLADGGTQTRYSANDWTVPDGVRGLAWDGTRFHILGSSGKVWHFGQTVTAVTRQIKYTQYRAGVAETNAGPSVNYNIAPRTWTRIEGQPPGNSGGPNDPDSLRFYVSNHLQPDLGVGVTGATYDLFDLTSSGSPANGFSSLPSSLGFSDSDDGDVDGAYTYFDGTGDARIAKLLQDGEIVVPAVPVSGGVAATIVLTFPVPFLTVPVVMTEPKTTRPDLLFTSTGTPTTTSVTIYVIRTGGGTADVTVKWRASTGY